MASAPLPDDPRNGTDWQNPQAGALVKVDFDTPLEKTLYGGEVVFAFLAALVLWNVYLAPIFHERELPLFAPEQAPLIVLSLVGVAFVLVGARAATDNFYPIDRGHLAR